MNMGRQIVGTCLFLLMVLLLACGPKPAPVAAPQAAPPSQQPTGPAPTTSAAVPAKAAWEVQWDETISAARKEGSAIWFTVLGRDSASVIVDNYKKKFGMTLEVVSGVGGQLSAKVNAERRAGLYLEDVYVGGVQSVLAALAPSGALDPIEPALILPEVKDLSKWFEGRLNFIDKAHTMLTGASVPMRPIAINTNLVKPGEVTSYRDLLNPKWKGKIIMTAPTVSGAPINTFTHILNFVGEDYLRQLVNQEPVLVSDTDLPINWLGHGKYPVALGASPSVMVTYMAAGLPIQPIVPKDAAFLSSGTAVALMNRAPHPNAARVFINWWFSQEGQTLASKVRMEQSLRLDVPADFLPPELLRQPGVKYWEKDTEEGLQLIEAALPRAKEFVRQLQK